MVFAARLLSSAFLACAAVACVTSDPIGAGGGGDEGPASGSGGSFDVSAGSGGSSGVASPTCGDAVCSGVEDCASCPEDCPCEDPVCGDGTCDAPAETCSTCADDCGACASCGDGTCDATEDCASCFQDCGVCACAPDLKEPNDGSASATQLTTGVDHCMLSVCSGDVDWFKIPATTSFTATASFAQGQGDLDLEIYSGIDFSYVDGAYSHDDDESLTLSGLPNGAYYVRVYGYSAAENPDYCLRVDVP